MQSANTSFDILSAATNAYKTSWYTRSYLLKLATVPFVLKLICFTTATAATGPESDASYLRFMLIMLPALLAEGWMLSHYVRFIVLGQTWPFQPTGNIAVDLPILKIRARGILSGMIVFVLINMAIGLLMTVIEQYMMPYMPAEGAREVPQVPASIALLSFLTLGFMIWGFRLAWLYIPFALNMNPANYFKCLKGIFISIQMVGVWILCSIPFLLALQFIANLVSGQEFSSFVIVVFSVITDTLKGIVTTAGMTYGLKDVFSGSKDTRL